MLRAEPPYPTQIRIDGTDLDLKPLNRENVWPNDAPIVMVPAVYPIIEQVEPELHVAVGIVPAVVV